MAFHSASVFSMRLSGGGLPLRASWSTSFQFNILLLLCDAFSGKYALCCASEGFLHDKVVMSRKIIPV